MADSNSMRDIYLDKLIVNIGIGQNENLFPNAKALLEKLTGHKAIATVSKKREPELKLRKGQIIGSMVTLRKDDAASMLKMAIDANSNTLKKSAISNNSLNFGIKEYIYMSGVKYDPKIGMFGMNINASFMRKGKRVEKRRIKNSRANPKHSRIAREEIIEYLKNNYKATVSE